MERSLTSQYENRLVSIVVPSYNYANYLSECIETVLSQTHKNFELLIVDDGSTDNTREVVYSYNDSRINYIYKENGGLSAARNTGIENISGEYVLFLDADDLIEKTYISKQIKFLENNQRNAICVAKNKLFTNLNDQGKPVVSGSWHLYSRNLDTHILFFNLAPPHCYFYRRSVVDKVGYFDTALKACEDYDYILRCVREGFRFGVNRKALAYYRVHPSSMSANKERQHYYDSLLHERVAGYFFGDDSYPKNLTLYYPFLTGVIVTALRLCDTNPDRVKRLLEIFQNLVSHLLINNRIDNLVKLQYFILLKKLARHLISSMELSGELRRSFLALTRKKIILGDYCLLIRDLLRPESFDLLTLAKIGNEIVRIRKNGYVES